MTSGEPPPARFGHHTQSHSLHIPRTPNRQCVTGEGSGGRALTLSSAGQMVRPDHLSRPNFPAPTRQSPNPRTTTACNERHVPDCPSRLVGGGQLRPPLCPGEETNVRSF